MEIQILQQDADDSLEQYLDSLFLNIHGDDVDFKKVEKFSSDSYKIINFTTFNELEDGKKLKKFFLLYNDDSCQASVSQIGKTTPECIGIININKDIGFYIPFIESFLSGQNVVSSQKVLLKKLNGVMQSVLGQLQRVKGIHERVVPVRSENVRGLKINSRFCAGTSSGGEFFDFFKSGSNLWLFSINASSYITIGSFLSLIENWKTSSNLTQELILQTLNSGQKDFSGLGDMSIFFARIDISTYEMHTVNIGGHELISKSKVITNRNDQAYPDNLREMKVMTHQLEKGEQILLLSPGFFKNTSDTLNGDNYYQFIKTNWTVAADMIQELTFQSKKKYHDLDFMPFDQTILSIGVDKNAISKI